MNDADIVRLRHMVDAARKAITFLAGRSRADLDHDEMLTLSLVKCIEIIGEAASRISPECERELNSIPWSDIIGMRNRLVHAYFDINREIVWRTVKEELPTIVAELEQVLPPHG